MPIIYNKLDSTICNADTQSELSHIPSEFAIQNLEGNALSNFVLGSLHKSILTQLSLL